MATLARIPNLNKGDVLHRRAEHITSTVETPLSASAKIAAANKDPRIDVLIFKRPDGTHYAMFKLYSHVKPNYLVRAPLDIDRKSIHELDFEAGVLCGAMAERINEVYLDNFDVERTAHEGSSKLADVLRAWARA